MDDGVDWHTVLSIARWRLAWCEQARRELLAKVHSSDEVPKLHLRYAKLTNSINTLEYAIWLAEHRLYEAMSHLTVGKRLLGPLDWM